MADIIANPHAISYGSMHRSKIHGFLYKMVKLFEPRAEKKSVRITLHGSTDAEILAYNSFQFMPLILLDNAVKYSTHGKDIGVVLRENATDGIITVASFGKVVPQDFTEKIFDKYVRGPNVEKNNPHGMGMGLYIARLIAEAHGSVIKYSSHTGDDAGDSAFGSNDFTINIHKASA